MNYDIMTLIKMRTKKKSERKKGVDKRERGKRRNPQELPKKFQ